MTLCHESYMLRYIENIFLVIQQNGCVYLFQCSLKQRQYILQQDGDEFGIRKQDRTPDIRRGHGWYQVIYQTVQIRDMVRL